MKQMTMKQRMLAFIQSKEFDRIPFVQYDVMAPPQDVWKKIGRENIGLLRWVSAHRYETSNCRIESKEFTQDGLRTIRNWLHTPIGTLTELQQFDPNLNTPSIREHYIKEISDYKIFLYYLRDIKVLPDYTEVERTIKEFGEDGLVHTWIGRTPYQQMWIQWVRIEELALHMADEPALLEEVFELLGKLMIETVKAIRNASIPYYVIGDNITAPMIGEYYFRKYCLPYYNQTAEIMADKNIPLVVHMDGDLKPLWQAIGESKVTGLDSFSPPPDNDTSAAEAVKMWPDKKLMLNFPSSVHLENEEVIYNKAMEILQQAGHTGRLWIQISENMPPGMWVNSYPAIAKAIADFGRPMFK
jgi:hypothetical protein